MVWRDGYGDDVESLITMGELPSDEATRTGSTKTMYGRCSDLELIGIRKVLICDIDELTQEECIGKFKIIYRDGVGTIE